MSTLQLKEQIFKLPSLGLPYPGSNLLSGDSVKIRPLVVGDQRYLTAGKDSYTAYLTMLNRIVIEPKGFDFNKLLLVDLNTLVYGIRILSFGSKYFMPFICNECEHFNTQYELDLNTVECTFADEVKEGFKSTDLEITFGNEQKLTCHLPTLEDDKIINQQLKSFTLSNRLEDETTDKGLITLAQSIDTINGKPETFNSKFSFLSQLSFPEFNEITKQVMALSRTIGISGNAQVVCSSCQTQQVAGLVITPEFFRI